MISTHMDNQEPQALETTSENDAVLLVRIEEMIKTHMAQIDTLKEDITKRKDMLDDIFVNDETFQEHDKVAKEAAKIKANTKKEILKRSDAADLSNQLKSLKSEQKELKEGLSDYLREYQRLSGSNEIEGEDGEIRQIVYTAKLIKKSQNFKPR